MDVLVLEECPTKGWADSAITAKNKYTISFTQSRRVFELGLNNNGSSTLLFVNATKPKTPYTLCLGDISKDFTINSKKKTELKGVELFSLDYDAISTGNILCNHRYLMKEACYKITFWFIQKIFAGLLSVCVI